MAGLDNGAGSQSKRGVPSRGAVSMGSHSIIEVLLLLRLAPPAVVEISLSHLILSHLASHFFDPQVTQTPDGADGARSTRRTSPQADPSRPGATPPPPAPGNGLGRVAPVFQGIVVARLSADAVSPTVESTAGPPLHGWRLARHRAPVLGTSSRARMHAKLLSIDTGIRQGRRSRNPQSAAAITNFLPGTRRLNRKGPFPERGMSRRFCRK
jgi:hypothetical protein